jgi:hypothetical protein
MASAMPHARPNFSNMMLGFLKKLKKFETWVDELIIIKKKNSFNLTILKTKQI